MNILQEYLVRLGFQSDQPSFDKMQVMMADAERSVTLHTSGMTKRILEAQGAIVGAFTAISGAIIGVVDKAAMADQGYRLMGLRMLMTTESARKLDLITKALGADLPQIVWDRELHERAVIMSQDIDKMTAALGPDFENRMLGIRDLRFEFSRLEVAMKFLGFSFASNLFAKLNLGNIGDRIKGFVDWFEDKIPELSDKLATYAVPILKSTWRMVQELGEVLKAAGIAFTNLVGLFSGDTAIQGASFSFEKMATAIAHVGDWMTRFFSWIAHAEMLLAHFASAMSLALSGKFSEASAEFKAGLKDLTGGSGTVLGAVAVAPAAPLVGVATTAALAPFFGPLAIPAGIGAAALTPAIGAGLGYLGGKLRENLMPGEPETPAPRSSPNLSKGDLIDAIRSSAQKYSVLPALALAIAQQESGIKEDKGGATVRSGAGALGVMQLMPSTAKGLGVDPTDALQNIDGGVKYLGQLLDRYHGDSVKAIAAYNAGPGRVDKAGDLSQLPAETRAYVPSVMRLERQFSQDPSIKQAPPSPIPAPFPSASLGQPDREYAAERVPAVAYASERPEYLNRSAQMERSAPAILQRRDESVPGWYDATPRFMSETPSWYETAPQWLTAKYTDTATRMIEQDGARLVAYQRPSESPANISHSSEQTVNVGGISVYVTQPGADAYQIQRAVSDGVRDGLHRQTQLDLAQISPVY